MRIVLIATGGLAGVRPRPVMIDTAKLSAKEAKRIEKLMLSSGYLEMPAKVAAPSRQPDRFQYTLHVAHNVVCDEEVAPEGFLELVREIQSAGPKK